LKEKGKLTVTGSKVVFDRIEKEPQYFGKVEIRRVQPPADLALGPDGSADLVLTFRNVHNWMGAGYAENVFAAAFKVLKHGGTLGVAEHRAKPGTDASTSKETGYVTEDVVIGFAKQAGFVLDARSEINANPKDTKDHKGGVWALPPSFANEDVDRAKYAAIGESDRMTLRFKKP
jgi:predicted methyltransferase